MTITVLAAGSFAACQEAEKAPPETGTFVINFPSVAAAVFADTLQVFVFEAGDSSEMCRQLTGARITGRDWPVAPRVAGNVFAPCDALGGDTGAFALPAVDFGPHDVVVVGQAGGRDVLIGCQRLPVNGQHELPVAITLGPLGAVPPTRCTTLRDHCDRRCPP